MYNKLNAITFLKYEAKFLFLKNKINLIREPEPIQNVVASQFRF
jgi:hypothetical protein